MMDIETERKAMLERIAVEKGKRRPNKQRIEMLEERVEALDIVEGTRDDDEGFRWMVEVKEYSDVLKDDSICVIQLRARSKEDAIKEVKTLIRKEFKKAEIKRVRLYQAYLTKQFRSDEL